MKHTHFIGIGGTGLSAIAKVLIERGENVSGSDQYPSENTADLEKLGAKLFLGHNAKNIIGADVIVRSSAIPADNVECRAAEVSGIPVLTRRDFFPSFFAENQVIGIAGTHGKTSTSSMTAWMLDSLDLNPGYILGSKSINLKTNASAGKSKLFVIEADEYDHMFWGLNCQIAVITNLEHDHPDCFPTPGSYEQAFKGFIDRIQQNGTLIYCIDDPLTKKIAKYAKKKKLNLVSYSLENKKADYYSTNIKANPNSGFSFLLNKSKEPLTEVSLSIPGKHSILNSTAALIIADLLYQNSEDAAKSLSEYQGAQRRFQIRGETSDIIIVDDYGHHPTEIQTTLAGARATYPDRNIVAVWEPHTYSRTIHLIKEFANCFNDANQVIITELYPARETKPEGFNPTTILSEFNHPSVQFQDSINGTIDFLNNNLNKNDLLIVFSAGKAVVITSKVYDHLKNREVQDV